MRSRPSPLRGEAARVAERVRAVVAAPADRDAAPQTVDDRAASPATLVGGRFAARLDPGRRAVLAIVVVVVLAAVATGIWVLASRPRSMPVSDAAPTVAGSELVRSGSVARSSSSASSPLVSSSGASTQVVVDVAGKVARPGLYRLPSGSRVDDAVRAAGGPLRGVDLGSLNLAAPLVDGQQIAVGRPPAAAGPTLPGSTAAGGSGGAPGAGGPVNLNSATLEQLETLPGIGPALGQRILDYRTEHGSFTSVDQLDDVSGIGTVTFERLKPLVTV